MWFNNLTTHQHLAKCWVGSSLFEGTCSLLSHLQRKEIMSPLVLIGSTRYSFTLTCYIEVSSTLCLYCLQLWMKRLLRLSSLLCLVSASLNTPKTFEMYPFLRHVTFVCDLTTSLLFTAEMVVKINTRGLLKVSESFRRLSHVCRLFNWIQWRFSGRRFILEGPVVSFWHQHAFLPLDLGHPPGFWDDGIGAICFLSIHSSSPPAVDHDSIHPCLSKIFHAEISYQPDFQVHFSFDHHVCHIGILPFEIAFAGARDNRSTMWRSSSCSSCHFTVFWVSSSLVNYETIVSSMTPTRSKKRWKRCIQ